MSSFWVGDMHGDHEALEALLHSAGILDHAGFRRKDVLVGSIGDLINGTWDDAQNDEIILQKAHAWLDVYILGNHDAAYDYERSQFKNFMPAQPVRTELNRWLRTGKIVPSYVIKNTLITHAGVSRNFKYLTALEAHNHISYVFNHYWELGENREVTAVFDGVSKKRDGQAPQGGILWADWDEPKNVNFNQVVGHTPIYTGPVIHQHYSTGIFTLNIDTGAKKGRHPYGVFLDDDGQIVDMVTVENVLQLEDHG